MDWAYVVSWGQSNKNCGDYKFIGKRLRGCLDTDDSAGYNKI